MPNEGAQQAAVDRIPSGILGLDTVLDGGLLAGSVQVVAGPPGSGKTILANQIAFCRAAQGQTAVYVTLLAEAHARMLTHLGSFAFFDPTFVSRRIVYMSGYGVLEQGGLDGLLELLGRTIREHGATLLVLDGLSTAEEFAPTASAFKRFLLTLSTSASLTGCTTLLLATSQRPTEHRLEHATVDGIMELDNRHLGVRVVRELTVQKMRATNYQLGTHAMSIDKSGLRVHPRLEGQPFMGPPELPSERRLGFDVSGLDAMLGGGLPEGSATALLGRPGTGKTLIAMSFLAAGARRGELGIYLGFREGPAHVVRTADAIGLDVSTEIEAGRLILDWVPPIEGVIDEIAWRLLDEVEKNGRKRVVIDGLDGFRRMATDESRMERFYAALVAALAARGATTILSDTLEVCESVSRSLGRMPPAFLDNVLVLRESEEGRKLRRFVAAQKLSGGAYDVALHKLSISDAGISVERRAARKRRRGGDA